MNTKKTVSLVGVVLIFALGIGIGVVFSSALTSSDSSSASSDEDNEPLYWVAPMDANYKRDKPGKSPMGMDLVPVYKDADAHNENSHANNNAKKEGPGAVRISPEVINNMGVRTAEVSLGTLSHEINTVGYVQYDEDRLVHIHPRVEGWIEKLYVKAKGDPVTKGQPLYTLYSPTLVNAQEEYLLGLRRNNSVLINAAKERLTALQVPESEINRIRSAGKVSQTITIKAPQGGVLDFLNAREGMYVQPGIKMMSIGELQHLWIIGEVFERQLNQVSKGDQVTVSLDYLPGTQWMGMVDYIYPSLNEKTRSAKVRIHIDNPDEKLRPGMFANLLIQTATSHETIIIPSEALIRMGRQTDDSGEQIREINRVVLALGDGRFKSINVSVGQRSRDMVEILSGLTPGDIIVTSAQFLIDSESSKTSDFKRMSSLDHSQALPEPSSVSDGAASVDGIIQTVNHQTGTLTIARGPITQWDRPAATLDFNVIEGVNIHAFEEGDAVRFTFEVRNGEFTVIEIQTKASSISQSHSQKQGQEQGL
jgi:Cu(I)/Ag(I) efflux system membrane fusion protein